jgi:hypothetical protein
MDCPLTSQGLYTMSNRIGAKRARQSSQSNLSRSLSTNHMRAFSVTRNAETAFNASKVLNSSYHSCGSIPLSPRF